MQHKLNFDIAIAESLAKHKLTAIFFNQHFCSVVTFTITHSCKSVLIWGRDYMVITGTLMQKIGQTHVIEEGIEAKPNKI